MKKLNSDLKAQMDISSSKPPPTLKFSSRQEVGLLPAIVWQKLIKAELKSGSSFPFLMRETSFI